MAFDSLMVTAVTSELQEKAVGARIQRIYQPDRFTVIFYLHLRGEQLGLIFSCHPQWARVHLTGERYRNPEQPAPFCMLLRKYLVGGSIAGFRQSPPERVVEIEFRAPEGLPAVRLIAEIMDRRSNLILVDGKGTVLGAIRTAGKEQNPVRTVLPGEPYQPVPPQNKKSPLGLNPVELSEIMLPLLRNGAGPQQALLKSVAGISPLAATELIFRSRWADTAPEASIDRLCGELRALFNRVLGGESEPTLSKTEPVYAVYSLTHLPPEDRRTCPGVNEMLDYYYGTVVKNEKTDQLRARFGSAVRRQLERLKHKYEAQQIELQSAEDAPLYRLCGELLLTYGSRVPRGAKQVELPDSFQPGCTVKIELDPGLTAASNAQKYFSRYRKAQKGQNRISEQLARTRSEIDYCESLLFSIEHGAAGSLEDTGRELVEAGLIKPEKKAHKQKEPPPQPHVYRATSGRSILVGQNNRQNDYITFKIASRRDTWLHVRDLPGSHVLIKEAPYPPPEEDLEEAALLAAYFSRGKESSATAVDYTQVRHVRRGPGGKPGFVLYENYRTITVNPSGERMRQLLAQQSNKI
ncbi:MAG: NFACT family protein [Bacillota bacterium]